MLRTVPARAEPCESAAPATDPRIEPFAVRTATLPELGFLWETEEATSEPDVLRILGVFVVRRPDRALELCSLQDTPFSVDLVCDLTTASAHPKA